MRRLLTAPLLVLLLATAPAAGANTAPGAITQALIEPRLAGEGELRWFGLRVYTAQLWVGGAPGLQLERLPTTPFALDLRYGTALKGAAIASRSLQEIERLGYGDATRRSRWSEAMQRVFPDVSRGDRLTGVHEPGRGVRFFHNDRPLGLIEDPEFARAFFAIWLDERTVAPALREALLRASAEADARR